jgi:tetratricopeptide (TPR) repeat protein
MRAVLLLPVALLVAACGHAPPETSVRAQAAIDANLRARAAYARGEADVAQRLFGQALAAGLAIDDADGIAVNALSLAAIEQAAGRLNAAHERLDALLGDPLRTYPKGRLAEACARKALLHLGAGQIDLAQDWTARARQQCAASCEALASILGIRAQLALRQNDYAGALTAAAGALDAARARGQRAEEANMLRLSGEAHLAGGEAARAVPLFEQALAFDRDLGEPRKVRLDLLRLGLAMRALGRADAARLHWQHALAVSDAAGDERASSELRALLATLD